MCELKYVYKITYPNGKIYVGMDLPGDPRYFGSPSKQLLLADFTLSDLQDFTVRKQILWQTTTESDGVVRQKEQEFIKDLGANNPEKGYNQRPKYTKQEKPN